MKDNKGFTLVELLAVIAILAILGLIALEAIESVNKGNKEKAEKANRNGILTSAVAYVPTSEVKLPNVITGTSGCKVYEYKVTGTTGSGTSICQVNVYLSYLNKSGVLADEITNPNAGKKLNLDSSYVSIIYLTSASSVTDERKETGKFDGNYFYELHEVYVEG